MKKLICVLLSVLMIFATLTFVACSKKEATLKFGMGVYTAKPSATSATADKDGEGNVEITLAVITVDADNKVVACQLDTADNTVTYTADGKAVASEGFKTKGELGDSYGMVQYGGAAKEWYAQADAFEAFVVGKTLDEIKSKVAEGDKGTDDVVAAGCTIMIADFVKAIEKAYANLADSSATASSALKLGIYTQQSTTDAGEEKDGTQKIETTAFAAAIDGEGKVVAATTDCVQVEFTFDKTGVSTFDTTKAIASKREAGADYGMVKYGGATKEWFEQADAFVSLCIGKTASEITALCVDGKYGTDEVKTAGCTILVNGFVKAAAKIG